MNVRPVSAETLASIPWMSAKSLSHAMREVSLRGPNEAATWQQLLSRADVIARSFNAKQSALVLNSIARVRSRDCVSSQDAFLTRFVRRFLPHIIPSCNALDTAQIIHSLSLFPTLVDQAVVVAAKCHLSSVLDDMNEQAVSMTAAGLGRLGGQLDPSLIEHILARGVELNLGSQAVAQLLTLAANSPHTDRHHFMGALGKLTAQLTNCLPEVRSLAVILNALARLQLRNADFMSLVAEAVMDDSNTAFTHGASVKQLTIILRSLQKLSIMNTNPLVCFRLVDLIRRRPLSENVDNPTVCLLLSAVSRMNGMRDFFVTVLEHSVSSSRALQPDELTVILQAVARMGGLDTHACVSTLLSRAVDRVGEFSSAGLARLAECVGTMIHAERISVLRAIATQIKQAGDVITVRDKQTIHRILDSL